MAIFRPPAPVFTGGAQPFGQQKVAAIVIAPVNPPPPMFGGPSVAAQEIAATAQTPWLHVFQGGWQAYAPRKLYPALLDNSPNNPPFTLGGPIALKSEITRLSQPDPWVYDFEGGWQAYAPRRLPVVVLDVAVTNPPFRLGGPTTLLSEIANTARPDPWPYVFEGEKQPYAPERFTATGGSVAQAPPFSHRSRTVITAEIVARWQPDPWVHAFQGDQQPYAPRMMNPAFLNNPTPPVPPAPGGVFCALATQTGGRLLQQSGYLILLQHCPVAPGGGGRRPDVQPFLPQPPWEEKARKPFKPVWDRAAPKKPPPPLPEPYSPKNPAPPPPRFIFRAAAEKMAMPKGLPSFDDMVPTDVKGMGQRMADTEDMNDALAVLKALGMIKK